VPFEIAHRLGVEPPLGEGEDRLLF
jgi:hypothetical protein